MLIKVLLFVAFYIAWVMGSLAFVFGVLFGNEPDGKVSFIGIIIYGVIIMIPVFLFNRWLTGEPGWAKTVRADGKQASATVVSVKDGGFSINRNRVYKFKLRVTPRDEEPFEVTLERMFTWFAPLYEGQTIQVRYDTNNKKHVVVLSDKDMASGTPSVSFTASRNTSQATLDPELQQLMDMEERERRGQSSASSANISEELAKLAQLHKNGDLSDAEFEKAKKKLLG